MTTFNLKHIAKAYNDDDLNTLIAECEILSARLSNVVNMLERDNGTIAESLLEHAGEVGKIAEAARLSKDLKHGHRVFRINGEWVSERTIDAQVDYYHEQLGYPFVEAIDKVFIDHNWSFEDRMAMGYA